ncbi:MAG: FHA domain-containing protein, partial [Pseudomonadota bacterium]
MAERFAVLDHGSGRRYSLSGRQLLMGRADYADIEFSDDNFCSREQATLVDANGQLELHPISKNVEIYVNGFLVESPVAISVGDEITFANQRLSIEEESASHTAPPRKQSPALSGKTQRVSAETLAKTSAPLPTGQTKIFDGLLIGRIVDAGDLALDHPSVSRKHAKLSLHNQSLSIRDLGSTNGTFVNGRQIFSPVALADGDRIDIGPYSIAVRNGVLQAATRANESGLSIIGGSVDVSVKGGGVKRILNDVSYSVGHGEFVCIVGPSGSGKSTLMNALSGRMPLEVGVVELDDLNLHQNFQLLKQDIALVPQHDVLHEDLPLAAALNYTAKLRLPNDLSASLRTEIVHKSAAAVDLDERLDTQIGSLSGGQKKRASLASETINDPRILFLDEVTSGLDESTDREIMRLLQRRAREGTMVICVTHTLANVVEFCDTLIVMAEGGYLAYAGPADGALDFFGAQRLGEIYDRLKDVDGETWNRRYNAAHSTVERTPPQQKTPQAGNPPFSLKRAVHQFGILCARNAQLIFADRKGFIMAAVQSVLIGVLMGYAFTDFGKGAAEVNSKNALLLLLGLSAVWLGCNSSSQQIIGELPIFRREADVNLGIAPFVLSKFVVGGVFTMIQIAVLFVL